ncbi:GNAT family N-acetyltransferase [Rahnella sp. SAP-1]|uniref:GNAT family N-acetyltransferase n=1 Tax=Rouxiella aceris TaxID=2703884 RepID=A0A848MFV2_9GAMM|nr:GNAT family N-acetyltransferase [Rouxiella aceris]NMP26256.1 GNAT family N-acetyltransferase [Rouxiella aceris]
MLIRDAVAADAPILVQLLAQLDYPASEDFIRQQIARMQANADSRLLVAVIDDSVCGFISLHFIAQLPLAGDFCRVSYLCVSDGQRGAGVGQQLLDAAERLAAGRGCDRMEVHSHSRRLRAHQFYARAGYQESPKYFIKHCR